MYGGGEESMSVPPREAEVQKLFLRHSSLLRGFIVGLLGELDGADDLLHEVFLVASRRAGDFEPGSDFPAWARAIARRKVLEHLRQRRNGPARLSTRVVESLADSAPEVDETFDARRTALARCLEEVRGRARQLIALRYGEGLSPEGIARRVSWKVAAVNVALSRARRFLRECAGRRLAADGEH
jgi:RNA polymerase sigma-70 factor (ECF subfamily)